MVQHGATWCNIVQYLLGGADRPLGLLNQHGSSHPAEDGEVPGPRQRHRGRRLQVLQHPPGNWDKGSDQSEEQAGPESLVHGDADQEDQERGVDVQQARPSGLIYTVEC